MPYSLVPPESNMPDEMCHVLAWTEVDSKTGELKQYRYRFVKKEIFHGILPRICEHLVFERKKTKAKISPENDPVTNITLSAREQSLKISANSMFGALGVKEGRMPLPEGARSICAMGRVLKHQGAAHVEQKHNGTIVYGDTDSIMVDLKITDPHKCIEMGKQLAKEFKEIFVAPLELTFERAIAIGFFIKKKKYAGVPLAIVEMNPGDSVERVDFSQEYSHPDLFLYKIVYTEKGKSKIKYVGIPKEIEIINTDVMNRQFNIGDKFTVIEPGFYGGDGIRIAGKNVIAGTPFDVGGKPNTKELMKKGIVLARRDNCIWIREAYMKVLLSILFDKPLEDTLNIVDDEIMKMMTRQVPFEKMMVTREIGRNYKPNSSYPLKIFSDELRKQGTSLQEVNVSIMSLWRCSEPERNEKQGYKMRLPRYVLGK